MGEADQGVAAEQEDFIDRREEPGLGRSDDL
jgi:hypothetical protein